ncbi:MAG: hypothetical protein AAF568_01870 [Pseudomonadota bacterium]
MLLRALLLAALLILPLLPRSAEAATLTVEASGAFAPGTSLVGTTDLSSQAFTFSATFDNTMPDFTASTVGVFTPITAQFEIPALALDIVLDPDGLALTFENIGGDVRFDVQSVPVSAFFNVTFSDVPLGFDVTMPAPGTLTGGVNSGEDVGDFATLSQGRIDFSGLQIVPSSVTLTAAIPLPPAGLLLLGGLGMLALRRRV